tara:strand:+ start:6356 stop:6724 length:369 start_codon:yes stop_codon:yes gene_type:complete
MTFEPQKQDTFNEALLKELTTTNKKLEKIIALLISNQLLEECISPDGEPREAQEMATIVSESYSAGLCLSDEMENRAKQYDYHKSEFFVDDEENETLEEADAIHEDKNDEEPPARGTVFSKF